MISSQYKHILYKPFLFSSREVSSIRSTSGGFWLHRSRRFSAEVAGSASLGVTWEWGWRIIPVPVPSGKRWTNWKIHIFWLGKLTISTRPWGHVPVCKLLVITCHYMSLPEGKWLCKHYQPRSVSRNFGKRHTMSREKRPSDLRFVGWSK